MKPLPPLPDKAALLQRVKPGRDHWDRSFRPANAQAAGPGEESVWDYPRPPVMEPLGSPADALLRVLHGDCVIAHSTCALAIKETAGAPVPYFPPGDVQTDWLVPGGSIGVCEWKGASVAYDLVLPSVGGVAGERVANAAWTYPDPFDDLAEGYAEIAGWFAFYPAKLACFVGPERARPQPGNLYGGWVTDRIKGPIKGGAGTGGW